MILRVHREVIKPKLRVMESKSVPGVYICDGLVRNDFLHTKYPSFLRGMDWRMSINAASQGVGYPYDGFPDALSSNKMWGISLFTEALQPPFNILSKAEGGHLSIWDNGRPNQSPYAWLFDLAGEVLYDIYDGPFDIWTLHVNGQTSTMSAPKHVDVYDNIIIMLTPVWKKEWGGGLGLYSLENRDGPPVDIIEYKPGRVIFFHGEKGHRDGYKFEPMYINNDKILHEGLAPSTECSELRITLNIRGNVLTDSQLIDLGNQANKLKE